MPRYLFLCKSCSKTFEMPLHMSEVDTARVKCPHCGSEQTERQVAAFAAVTSRKS